MKVIFLDVDGVLNSDEYFDRIQNLDIEGIESEIDINKVKLLKKAVDTTGAKVVLSSSWRYTKNALALKKLLADYGIHITDSTPVVEHKRGLEIRTWLENNNNVENFVILDDEVFDSYDSALTEKLVKMSKEKETDIGEGLLPENVEKIIERLGRIKDDKVKQEELER